MAIFKEKLLERIKNNKYFQHICFFEVDSGDNTSSDDGNTENTTPDDSWIDKTDTNLQYVLYTGNEEDKTVETTGINYDKWYENNGDYNVVIPATLGGHPTVIDSEG